MNSGHSEYKFSLRTQLIRCIFYISENHDEYIHAMHAINLDHLFHISGKNYLKTFGLFKFSYFVSDRIKLAGSVPSIP